jgi:hypothetical protein
MILRKEGGSTNVEFQAELDASLQEHKVKMEKQNRNGIRRTEIIILLKNRT